jgi:transcriptional/translational regulatory protein YebC/TACO1
MAKAIMVAVKTGGGSDPDNNFRLKSAIDKAKEFGVPKANIERAIENGAGASYADELKEITYEGFLLGGVAVMVMTATDNQNLTLADLRTIFKKAGGSFASCAYMFTNEDNEYKVTMTIDAPEDQEEKIFQALDKLDDNDDVIDFVTNLA